MDQESVEPQLQRLLDVFPDAIVVVTTDGRIVWGNQQTEQFFGYPRADLVGQPVEVLVPERLQDLHRQHRLEYFTAPHMRSIGIGLELAGRRQDGSEIPVEISLCPLATADHGLLILCIIRNRTERQQMLEALRTSEARYRELFESAPDGYHVTDADGRILDINQTELAWLGYARDEVVGRRYEEFVTLEQHTRLSALQATLTETGARHNVELELVRKNGSTFPGRMDEVAIYDAARRYRGSRASVHDLTHERAVARQAAQAQKLEIMGQVVGIVAHDLNNMLMVIQGYSALLHDSLLRGDPRRHEAEEVQQAVDRAMELIRQLLSFGRRQTLAPRVLNLNGMVTQMELMLQRLLGQNITIVTMLDQALGQVEVDPSQFEQVIMNLSLNARDAMPQGGAFTIETANITLEATEAWQPGALAPGSYVRLTVRDTGIGITAEVQTHLFEPFFTTKAPDQGTGLGLATVYGIVTQSGGAIQVESVPGQGATFTILLPRIEKASTSNDPVAKPSSHGQS